jgi:hypothetical protein
MHYGLGNKVLFFSSSQLGTVRNMDYLRNKFSKSSGKDFLWKTATREILKWM